MALLSDVSRCAGTGCPSRDICRRYQQPGDKPVERAVMTALYARREPGAAACDQYLERDAVAVPE